MTWWGRLGKILTFAGGATVVLDTIGAERLREWGKRRGYIRNLWTGPLVARAKIYAPGLAAHGIGVAIFTDNQGRFACMGLVSCWHCAYVIVGFKAKSRAELIAD